MLPVLEYFSFRRSFIYTLIIIGFSSQLAISQYAHIKDNSLLVLGNKVNRQGKYTEPEKIYRKAVVEHSSKKGSDEYIIAAVGLGASFIDQGEPDKAKIWMLRADSSVSSNTPLELQAYVKSNVGWLYNHFKNYALSLKNYKLALSLAKESGDQYQIAQVSNSLSLITRLLGYYDESVNYAKIAVYNFELIEDPFLLSMSYSNLSSAFEALGFIEKAEENLLKSLTERSKIQNEEFISTYHYRIGAFYHRAGKHNKALASYSKYLSFAEEAGIVNFIAPAYGYVGSVYLSLGEFEKALEYFNTSLRLQGQGNLVSNPLIILKIAQCYQNLSQFELAYSLYNQALDTFIEKENHQMVIDAYLNLSQLELDLNNVDKSLDYAEKALYNALKIESKQLKAKSYAALGKVNLELGNAALSLDLSKKAYNIASVFKGYSLARYSVNLSKAFYETGSDSAYFYADLAFKEIEDEQDNIYGDNLESGFFSKYSEFYDLVALWYLENREDIDKAFEVTERGRSRVLLERLSFSDQQLNKVLDESTLLSVRQKEKTIDELYRLIDNTTNDEELSKLKDQLRSAEFDYQSYTNDLRLQHPLLNSLSASSLISISELQAKLKSNEAVLEYMIAGQKLVIFVISQSESSYEILDLSTSFTAEEFLKELVFDFRLAIQEQQSLEKLSNLSKPLFEILIEPFSKKYPAVNKLVIVPTHSLSILPFDALYSNNQFLVEQYNIKYLPSSSIFDSIKDPHREILKNILAVAVSGFSSSSSNEEFKTQQNYTSLPSTLLEIEAIENVFEQYTSLKNEEVTESVIKSLPLNEYRYLHFATHGIVNEKNPQQSGLIISKMNDAESSFGEDGYLNGLEISNLTLQADLVVLSACNTAIGKIVGGEGLLGLQRSFFQAGASSVIVSLWNVYDKSTSILMGEFYKNLNNYEQDEIGIWTRLKMYFNVYEYPFFGYKENALRDAKLSLLDHPYYGHPINWAPFILIGK